VTGTTLLLLRHGETAWNAEHRIQGQLDVPLSPTGMRQAARLAARLADEPISAIYSSDLARAALTAAPLGAQTGCALRFDERLRERAFGIFEGATLEEIARDHRAEFERWRAREIDWAIPGGESARDLLDRVGAALTDIVLAHAGGTVAVVAHGGVLDAAYRRARTLPWDAPREHPMLNASINRLHAQAPPLALSIVAWGDVAHLDDARDESLT
jgi:2,3-bisphosphoglycerate-dependent phosphoglycerate mutase